MSIFLGHTFVVNFGEHQFLLKPLKPAAFVDGRFAGNNGEYLFGRSFVSTLRIVCIS